MYNLPGKPIFLVTILLILLLYIHICCLFLYIKKIGHIFSILLKVMMKYRYMS